MGRKVEKEPEPPSDEYDDDESTDSEDDYELTNEEISILTSESGLMGDVVLDLWKAQRGLCRVSDLPMNFNQGFYRATIVPRLVHKPISDKNAVMVCEIVSKMREVTDLPWKAFVSLLNNVCKDDF